MLPTKSVFDPIQSPSAVASIANTATPSGLRPGFHANGRPVNGSSAARPGRGTAPASPWSDPSGLLYQRLCPPTYTTEFVTVTPQTVSPPVSSTQVGCAFVVFRFVS